MTEDKPLNILPPVVGHRRTQTNTIRQPRNQVRKVMELNDNDNDKTGGGKWVDKHLRREALSHTASAMWLFCMFQINNMLSGKLETCAGMFGVEARTHVSLFALAQTTEYTFRRTNRIMMLELVGQHCKRQLSTGSFDFMGTIISL